MKGRVRIVAIVVAVGATDMTTDRDPELIRIERSYPLPSSGGSLLARRVSGPRGQTELALFGPDGREILSLERVQEAFARVDTDSIVPSYREETWVVERHGMRCRVVRTIDETGTREIVALNALNGSSLGPSIVPDPANRAIWARAIELSAPFLQRDAR